MRVCEIFKSIQGEGRYMGQPAIFIRLSGCNLMCKDCDTKYAWFEYTEIEPNDVIRILKEHMPAKFVVFTGGEPLLQSNAIKLLLDKIPIDKHMETNGTILSDVVKEFDYIAVSPKPGTNVQFSFWLRHRADIKFVIAKKRNSVAWDPMSVIKVINSANIDPSRIWFMPFGRTQDEIGVNAKLAWNLAIEIGANYSDRLHVRVWGDKRGV